MRKVLALLVICIAAVPAFADDEASDGVREHFDRGQQFYEQKMYANAAREFRAAYELKPAASFLFNEAVCLERLDDRVRAAALFREYLAASPNARDRDAVEKRIAALGLGIAREKPAPVAAEKLRGVFFIESKPAGATIYLDDKSGAPLGTTPWNGTIEGAHTLIVVERGYRDAQTKISAKPGSYNQVHVALAQGEYLGWLEVRSNLPGAEVYIDSRSSGAAGRTPYMANVTPGKHTVIVTREGFTEARREVTIIGGEPQRIDVEIERAPYGFVEVAGRTVEGASVALDGKKMCVAPCRFQAAAGEHRLTVDKADMKRFSRTITVGKATQVDVDVKLAPEPSRTDAYVKLALGAAFVGGGVGLGMYGMGLEDDIAAEEKAGGKVDSGRKTTAKLWKYGGGLGIVVGGATVVSGVISLVREKGPRSTGSAESRDLGIAGLRIDPEVAPGYAGVTAALRF